MTIGTAVPGQKELLAVNHHFIQFLSINDPFNAYCFEQLALKRIEKLFANDPYVFMTGGSGLYIDAVCYGIDILPNADEGIRNMIKSNYQTRGLEYLREEVKKADPDYYKEADINNPKRLMRALEVCLQTNMPYSTFRKGKKKERNFNIIKIGLNADRQILFNRINQRVDQMMQSGLLEEVKSLYPFKSLNALNTVGYKELFLYLDNAISLGQAVANIKTNTRRYAKRQLTWFKKDQEIRWFNPEEIQEIEEYITKKRLSFGTAP